MEQPRFRVRSIAQFTFPKPERHRAKVLNCITGFVTWNISAQMLMHKQPRFQKADFSWTNNVFLSKEITMLSESIHIFCKKSKTNAMFCRTLFFIYLTFMLLFNIYNFCSEISLSNSFWAANSTDVIETILESSHKVLSRTFFYQAAFLFDTDLVIKTC